MAGNVVFIGIKHCGKSTQGKLLAARLGWQFYDTDELLSEYCMQEYGMSSAEAVPRMVMQKYGEEFFRRAEAETIREWLKQNSAEKASSVLALGGGVPCNPFLADNEIKSLGTLVHLVVDPETAYKRIVANGIPPFLSGGDPHAIFIGLAAERTKRYSLLADVQIEVPAVQEPEDLCRIIYEQLSSFGFLK